MPSSLRTSNLRGMMLAAAGLAGLTFLCAYWLGVTNPTIAALAYLLVVLLAAAFSALWVALAASALAVVLLNYFFLPPVRTLTIAEPQNWVALFVLLAVSLVASHLSASVRARERDATARRDELARLFDLSRDILLTTETADAHGQLARAVARRFDLAYVAICLPTPAGAAAAGASPGWRVHEAGEGRVTLPRQQLEQVFQAARGALEFDAHERTYSGRQTIHSHEGPPVDLVPLRLAGRPVGLLAAGGRPVESGTLDTLAGIVAIAVERVQFLEERKSADLARQSAELKSALLASLAHDLRTPLTAIRVAASNLHASWASQEERQAQSEIVLAEVERLNRLFQNILDMARVETNAVTTAREWVTPADLVEAAVMQMQHLLGDHHLSIQAESSRVVELDPRLTSASLAHLLENAAQYSPPGTPIFVEATVTSAGVRVTVRDEGPGIADADLPHLFDRFYRGREAARHSIGAGIGLALTRGLLAVEDGRVFAENVASGGARFTIEVPGPVRDVAGVPEDMP